MKKNDKKFFFKKLYLKNKTLTCIEKTLTPLGGEKGVGWRVSIGVNGEGNPKFPKGIKVFPFAIHPNRLCGISLVEVSLSVSKDKITNFSADPPEGSPYRALSDLGQAFAGSGGKPH